MLRRGGMMTLVSPGTVRSASSCARIPVQSREVVSEQEHSIMLHTINPYGDGGTQV